MGMQRGLVERSRATDERADDLAPFRVRQADNGDLGDAGVFQQAVLDLGREMVLATPDDHFLDPSRHGDVAARIHPAQIAGVQPTHRVDSLGRGLGVVVVFQHDAGAAGTDFPDLTNGDGEVVIDAADRDLGLSHRLASRVADVVDAVVQMVLCDHRTMLGLAIERRKPGAHQGLHPAHQFGRHHRAAAADELQGRQVSRTRFLRVEQAPPPWSARQG